MPYFQSLSIILPVINETYSLAQTIDVILKDCEADVREFIIVICGKTTQESLRVCEEYKLKLKERIVIHRQTLPFLGGAIREAFEMSQGSHVLMMASDLETDPSEVKHFILEAKKNPQAIITATRWRNSKGFIGYNPLKWIANFLFQKIFAILYHTPLSDLTYGYRVFPVELVKNIQWQELRHPFLLETILKPLRLGVEVVEIPALWVSRQEGESQNAFFRNFFYFPVGWKIRFLSKDCILRKEYHEEGHCDDHHQPSHRGH